MISYIRHNSVFDLGSRTGVSTCTGLYAELDDIYSKYINPQVRVQYDNTDCLCNMSGKQTLEGGSHAFVFHNGAISVTVDEQDNVTIAEIEYGGGGSAGLAIHLDENYTMDKTWQEINDAILDGVIPILLMDATSTGSRYGTVTSTFQLSADFCVVTVLYSESTINYVATSPNGYPVEDQGN